MSIRLMHVDLDAFFVEVCRRHDPALRDVDLLIVGGRKESRGVVQSASYGARKFGIGAGMPIAQAVRLCPDATFVRGEFLRYREASRAVHDVLLRHSPNVAMTGLDEGYLDFTGTDLLYPVSLLDAAERVRNDISATTNLHCSIGIGSNRMIAKLATDFAKPRGICEVRQGWERGFLAGLPLAALPGVGPRAAARLSDHGLLDVAQVQALSHAELARLVGDDEATHLARRAAGHGGTVLRAQALPKSISRETTFSRDVSDPAELDRVLLLLTARVGNQLREEGLAAGGVTLKLRHADFVTVTRSRTFATPTSMDAELIGAARPLLLDAWTGARARGQTVRLIGIAAARLGQSEAPDLFESAASGKQRDVSDAVDAVRAKYGFDALGSGGLVRKRPLDHRDRRQQPDPDR